MKEYRKPSILDTLNSSADRAIPALAVALLGGYAAGRVVKNIFDSPVRTPQLSGLECVLSN